MNTGCETNLETVLMFLFVCLMLAVTHYGPSLYMVIPQW